MKDVGFIRGYFCGRKDVSVRPDDEKIKCPGERDSITYAICRARQKRNYPMCSDCPVKKGHESAGREKLPDERVEIFKAYDIRGIYPRELDETMARKIGAAMTQFLQAKKVVVGRDMRTSSPALAKALAAGITGAGADVTDVGLVPTETLYFATAHYKMDGGVMTTASHNPPEWNGFKLCREDAIPLSGDSGIGNIQTIVQNDLMFAAPVAGKIEERNVMPEYRDHVLKFAKSLRRMRVVMDAGNGMMGKAVPLVFESLPCEVVPLYFELDGTFPHHEPNPLKEENLKDLCKEVLRTGADLGVAFDGDGDRCRFVDEKGEPIASDLITAVIAREMLREDPRSVVVYDLRSSRVVAEEIRRAGGIPCQERVGHAFMKATLRKRNGVFGGELAGHYYYRENFFADSAMITVLKMLSILSAEGKTLSELLLPLKRYYSTGEMNFKVADKDAKIRQLAQRFSKGKIHYLDGITVEFENWWFNVRKSNTEPLLRLNLEASTPDLLEKAKAAVIEVIEQ